MSQKRKRAEIEDERTVTFAVAEGDASAVGPVLGQFSKDSIYIRN